MNTPSQKLIGALLDRFETSQIMIFLFGLWAIYAIAPEPIPFIDDIILGILTLQAARESAGSIGETADEERDSS